MEKSKVKATNENIDALIEEWHDGNSKLELHTYLGLTLQQYADWVKTNKLK